MDEGNWLTLCAMNACFLGLVAFPIALAVWMFVLRKRKVATDTKLKDVSDKSWRESITPRKGASNRELLAIGSVLIILGIIGIANIGTGNLTGEERIGGPVLLLAGIVMVVIGLKRSMA